MQNLEFVNLRYVIYAQLIPLPLRPPFHNFSGQDHYHHILTWHFFFFWNLLCTTRKLGISSVPKPQIEKLVHNATFKGTGHDFWWSGKPIYHLQKQGNIHMIQNKEQNPHKFDEIMKKNKVFGKIHSWGYSYSVFNFLNFLFYFVWCIWKKRKWFWELKNLIYSHDTVIKNGQGYHWSLKIKIYMIYF